MRRKLFCLTTALFLLVTGTTVSAQKLSAILTNMKYDAAENAIVFNIEIKGGADYVPGTNMGSVLAMDLKFDFFLEPGVTVDLTPYAVTATLTYGAPNVRDIGCGWGPSLPVYSTLPNPPAASLDFSILCTGIANALVDFKTDMYYSVATVKIPVTSEKKPGSETFLRQRPTINQSQAHREYPWLYRSFWGASASQQSPIFNGYFENQPDFHLRNSSVTDPGLVDIDENMATSIKVFPNPTSGIVNILFDYAKKREIALCDMSGKEIYKKQHDAKEVILDFGYLPDAAYLLKINNQIHSKIIIKH